MNYIRGHKLLKEADKYSQENNTKAVKKYLIKFLKMTQIIYMQLY